MAKTSLVPVSLAVPLTSLLSPIPQPISVYLPAHMVGLPKTIPFPVCASVPMVPMQITSRESVWQNAQAQKDSILIHQPLHVFLSAQLVHMVVTITGPACQTVHPQSMDSYSISHIYASNSAQLLILHSWSHVLAKPTVALDIMEILRPGFAAPVMPPAQLAFH